MAALLLLIPRPAPSAPLKDSPEPLGILCHKPFFGDNVPVKAVPFKMIMWRCLVEGAAISMDGKEVPFNGNLVSTVVFFRNDVMLGTMWRYQYFLGRAGPFVLVQRKFDSLRTEDDFQKVARSLKTTNILLSRYECLKPHLEGVRDDLQRIMDMRAKGMVKVGNLWINESQATKERELDTEPPDEISSDDEIEALKRKIDDTESFIAGHPELKQKMDKRYKALIGELEKYVSGQRKIGGRWLTVEEAEARRKAVECEAALMMLSQKSEYAFFDDVLAREVAAVKVFDDAFNAKAKDILEKNLFKRARTGNDFTVKGLTVFLLVLNKKRPDLADDKLLNDCFTAFLDRADDESFKIISEHVRASKEKFPFLALIIERNEKLDSELAVVRDYAAGLVDDPAFSPIIFAREVNGDHLPKLARQLKKLKELAEALESLVRQSDCPLRRADDALRDVRLIKDLRSLPAAWSDYYGRGNDRTIQQWLAHEGSGDVKGDKLAAMIKDSAELYHKSLLERDKKVKGLVEKARTLADEKNYREAAECYRKAFELGKDPAHKAKIYELESRGVGL